MKDKAGAVTKRGAPMGGTMKKLLIATVSSLVLITAAQAEDIKIGIEMGFTGPIETLTPPMAAAAELAVKEVNDSGDRKSTRLNSSHVKISYAVFCLKKKKPRTS